MNYISTRGGIAPVSFSEAVMMGLATDGGLLLPARIPDVSARLNAWQNLRYQDLATEVMSLYIGEDDIPQADVRQLLERSYATFDDELITPLVKTGSVIIQEMFHGPTLAFKDLALQFLGNLFEHLLARSGRRLNILAATSGDTGSAAIHGVRGKAGINIFVLHPHAKVSPLQERQMTTVLDDNVHNIAIEGTFDDGQRIIKELFGDLPFKKRYALGAVNSVNWARVLAQIVYYFYGAFRAREMTGKDQVIYCVPTGNFGNIFAGYLAKRMGAPISKLILATNKNDILARFFQTGVYKLGEVCPTLSPSMDIQVASNFERYLYYQVNEDSARLGELMQLFRQTGEIRPKGPVDSGFAASRGDTQETLAAIKALSESDNYVVDPHTAVGVAVAQQFLNEAEPIICQATAHPAKFPEAVKQAIGAEVRHPALDGLKNLPTRCAVLPASRDAVQAFIEEKLAG